MHVDTLGRVSGWLLCYVVRVVRIRTGPLCVCSTLQVLAQIHPSPAARFRHKPDWEATLLAGGCHSYGLFRWFADVDSYEVISFAGSVAVALLVQLVHIIQQCS